MPRAMSRIDARVPLHVREKIDYAASIQGRTRTDFIISAALEVANRVISEENVINLAMEDQIALANALIEDKVEDPTDFMKDVAKEYDERVTSL